MSKPDFDALELGKTQIILKSKLILMRKTLISMWDLPDGDYEPDKKKAKTSATKTTESVTTAANNKLDKQLENNKASSQLSDLNRATRC